MRRLTTPLTIGVTLLVCSACGGASTPSPTVAARTATATPTATQSASSTPTPVSPTASGPGACDSTQVAIALNSQQGAAGTLQATFEVRNTTTTDCTVSGFPQVSMATASSTRVPTTDSRGTNPPSTTVHLAPSTAPLGSSGATGHGWFVISWSDVCSTSSSNAPRYWEVTLPGAASPLQVSAADPTGGALPTVCDRAVEVFSWQPAIYIPAP